MTRASRPLAPVCERLAAASDTLAADDGRLSELGRPGARFARAERERRGARARSGRALDQNRSPALDDVERNTLTGECAFVEIQIVQPRGSEMHHGGVEG